MAPNLQVARMGTELFIGLVGAVGTNLAAVTELLSSEFRRVGYTAHAIRLSVELTKFKRFANISSITEHDIRVGALMTAGDQLREAGHRGDAVGLLGVSRVRETRGEDGGDEDEPRPNSVYIFHSLKRREEVRTFRDTYGSNFLLISVFAPLSQRRRSLCDRISESRGSYDPENFGPQADALIQRDRKESEKPLGQDVEATFPEADLFLDATDPTKLSKQISRFVQLLFGHPFVTPTVDELGMFHAKAASLRTADLSRQVGAVITTADGETLASGCNEVPRSGGGVNWEDAFETDKDYRDFVIGYDATSKMKQDILAEVFRNISHWLQPSYAEKKPEDLVASALYDGTRPILKGTRADSLLEFGRIVHAEMAAITEAARRGVALKNGRLYCTTFPCHMCARHILAAGIVEVVYIEPYPKSLAKELYKNMICVDADAADENAVRFRPFVGIAPRKFIETFQAESRKDEKGRARKWDQTKAEPKIGKLRDYSADELVIMSVLKALKTKADQVDLQDILNGVENDGIGQA